MTYTWQQGDSIAQIAAKLSPSGASADEIQAANPSLSDATAVPSSTTLLVPVQTIQCPQGPPTSATAASQTAAPSLSAVATPVTQSSTAAAMTLAQTAAIEAVVGKGDVFNAVSAVTGLYRDACAPCADTTEAARLCCGLWGGLATMPVLGSLLRPAAVQCTDSNAHPCSTDYQVCIASVHRFSSLSVPVQEVPASIKMCASMEGPGPYGSQYNCMDMITLNSYCCEPHCLLDSVLPFQSQARHAMHRQP